MRTLAAPVLATILVACATSAPSAPAVAPLDTVAVTPPAPSSPVPPASPLPSPAAPNALAKPLASTFHAWTDPAGVAALAVSCHPHAPVRRNDDPDPLSCELPSEQACVYNPCLTKTQECRDACVATCTSCDATCGGSCDRCTAACKDDACRQQCAAQTATCKQGCLSAHDRCATGTCGEAAAEACNQHEIATWKAHHCSCAKISPCLAKCPGGPGPCRDRCQAKFPGCDLVYCEAGGEPGDSAMP